MKKVVFLVAGLAQIPAIQYAKSSGYLAITIDNIPDNPGHNIADRSSIIDVYDFPKVLDFLKSVRPDAIVNFVSSHGIQTGIKARNYFNQVNININAYTIVDNKRLFREFLTQHGFFSPRLYGGTTQCIDVDQLDFPVIVKPVIGSGSVGIQKINNIEEYEYFLTNCNPLDDFLIEEYIEGEYRINGDCIVVENSIISLIAGDYYYSKKNNYVSYATSFPTNYDLSKIKEVVGSFVSKIAYGTGSLNFEIIVRDNKEYFIEINPRHSGNYLYDIMTLMTGYDIPALNVELALNNYHIAPPDKKYKYCAVGILFSDNAGIISSIVISDELKPFIKKCQIFKNEGDYVNGFKSLYDRLGVIILSFENEFIMNTIMVNFDSYYQVYLK